MNSKFQEIIATPAMTVPAMTTEEIKTTLLEASIDYAKKTISLDTLVLLASKIQYFMGMRDEEGNQIVNMLSKITEIAQDSNKQHAMFVDSMLFESVESSSKINPSHIVR